MKNNFIFFFAAIAIIILFSLSFEDSFAENLSLRQQWEKLADPDLLMCKEGLVLLQKNNGYPACVTPFTYFKLIDRDYTNFNFALILNRHDMMNSLMHYMILEKSLMDHWHEMMLKNPTVINQTMSTWLSMMKENSNFLANALGPMSSEPQLRDKMITLMKNHSLMENSLKNSSQWMDYVHKPSGHYSTIGENHSGGCSWCPKYIEKSPNHSLQVSSPDKMMDLIHHIWISDTMRHDLHRLMLASPSHMVLMTEYMIDEILNPIMDDPELRKEMIDLLLKHDGFMNSIIH